MNLDELKPNPNNPRKISGSQLAGLKNSIEKFGCLDGFIFNRRTGQMEGGHQRQKTFPPGCEIIITKKFDPPTPKGTVALGEVVHDGERYPYREVDWDEPTARAANIAANKHGGDWDDDLLKEELAKLDEFGLEGTGFSDDELEALLDTPEEKEKRSEGGGEGNGEGGDRFRDTNEGPRDERKEVVECPECGNLFDYARQ